MNASPRVLIVEDNADAAESLRLLLAAHQMAAETAPSLAGALARLAADGIDCAVLDLTLPDAHNIEAVDRLQADHPDVPILVLTGYSDLAVPALHAGAQEVLIKGGDPEVIARRVLYAIARHQVRRRFEPYVQALKDAKAIVEQQLEGGPAA